MNLTDSSVTSSHYYYSKRMGTTEENLNLDTVLWFKRVKRPSRLVLRRNGLRTSPTTKKKNHILLIDARHTRTKLLLKVNIRVLAA